MNSTEKAEKESEPSPVPFTINIMPVEHDTNIPERIDVMGLLYNNQSQPHNSASSIQQYLPKTLKKEITEEQIDGLYDNFKLLSREKNNKNASMLIDSTIMPFEKSSLASPKKNDKDIPE